MTAPLPHHLACGLLFALLIGYVVWDEVPNMLGWAGIFLLVISGLLILRSERLKIPTH